MPLFNMICSNGHERKILTSEIYLDKISTKKKTCYCGEPMKRKASGPTSSVKEILDNGLMVKRLERLSDSERLHRERNSKADPNAGKRNYS